MTLNKTHTFSDKVGPRIKSTQGFCLRDDEMVHITIALPTFYPATFGVQETSAKRPSWRSPPNAMNYSCRRSPLTRSTDTRKDV